MSGEISIRVDDLQKVYRPDNPELSVRAVDGVSFAIERGESVAITGPSGCGKSTLLHVLGCLDRPTAGAYFLGGEDVSRLGDDALARTRNRMIGFVFQAFNLLPRQSALENVALPLLYGRRKDTARLAAEALERVGLADRGHHLPSELSGGQRQRVAIARAVVTQPEILLCDEPTGALDSRTGEEVMALLADLNRAGTTVVVVTHDPRVADALGRRIRMKDGHVESDDGSTSVPGDNGSGGREGGADAVR